MPDQPWTRVGLHATIRFTLVADASPGLLPRLLMPFAKRDLTPDAFDATRVGADMRVEIRMDAMPAEMVHLVEGNLRATVGVRGIQRREEITGVVRRAA